MKQQQRDRVMKNFRNGKTEILIATDVAARGIDVDDIEAVFNFDIPQDDGDGRAGQTTDTGKIMFAFETNWLSDNLADQYIRLEVDKFTTDGTIDAHAGRHDTMFPLKNGTADSRNWGEGALSSYDTSNAVWEDAPDGHPKQAIYGYSDGWTTVLQNQSDTGLLAGTEGFSAVVKDGRIRFYAETPDLQVGKGVGYDDEGNEIEVPTYKGGIPAGRYLVRVKVCTVDRTGGENNGKEIVLGGQTMAVKVVGGETTTVVGSLLQEKYIDTGLSVTIPDSVAGSIFFCCSTMRLPYFSFHCHTRCKNFSRPRS